jgi:sortase A
MNKRLSFGKVVEKTNKSPDSQGADFSNPTPKNSQPGKNIQLIIKIVGNLLIFAGVAYLIIWSYPMLSANISYYFHRWRGLKYEVSTEPQETNENGLSGLLEKPKEPLKIKPSSTDFGIVIEKINVNAPIVSSVDPANKDEYSKALDEGVAHAAGTVFPGENGNSFLFSHSTFNVFEIGQYNAVFTLLNKLETGDKIVTFYKGTRFDYVVAEMKVVSPSDVSPLTASHEAPVLTLQTCDPPGTDLNRLIVVAKLVE